LTEYLVRIKCKSCSWTLPTFPGHVKLPDDLFKNLPNPEIISEIMKRSYIPSEFLKILEKRHASTHSKSDKPKTNKKGRKTSSQIPKKKRKIDADAQGTPTRKSAPRAAKSNIKSMAVISTSSDDDSEKSNDISEANSDTEMKDAESSNVNQSEQGRDGSEYDEMDIEPKVRRSGRKLTT